MKAIYRWQQKIMAHSVQASRIQQQSSWESADFWKPFEARFRVDPHRRNDKILNRLYGLVTPETTILDVGGGAGRFALPLALRCKQVTVVEPSVSMAGWLEDSKKQLGLNNIEIVQKPWEEAEVTPQDLVLCAFVLHGVMEIEPFIQKLAAHACQRVMILEHMDPPDWQLAPLWKAVHGEELLRSAAVPDLIRVLWDMDLYPDLEMFRNPSPETVANRNEALQILRHLIYVNPDTAQYARLQKALDQHLKKTTEGFSLKGALPARQALISWRQEL